MEDYPAGHSSITYGGSTAQNAMMMEPEVSMVIQQPPSYGEQSGPEEPQFTELELKVANRFLELVGGVERARKLINKCDECQECLDMVTDDQIISQVADSVPLDIDTPTYGQDISALYNPSAIAKPMP